ncbi:hypothetical protein B0H11DRAFT_1970273 [Mycena galericulata]|nr:hypothetical protein B0H11DRAFT_1970273 [Mycena galericulata]
MVLIHEQPAESAIISRTSPLNGPAADRPRIADIDAQVRELEEPPQFLRDERGLLNSKKRLDGYICSILTLPTEIVLEIFSLLLPVYPRRPPAIGVYSPAKLAQICHIWREIALSTRSLWRAMSFFLVKEKRLKSQMQILETWAQRSGNLPLSIAVVSRLQTDVYYPRFIQAMVPHCARWEYLRLDLPLHDAHWAKSRMPLLRSLEIGLYDPSGILASIPSFNAPNLHRVTLERYLPIFDAAVPWAQLTTLILNSVTPKGCARILKRTPNLVNCSLSICESMHSTAVTFAATTSLRRLESLIIAPKCHSSPRLEFGTLTLPALRRLQMPEFFLARDPILTLLFLISRWGCTLDDLHITHSTRSAAMYRTAFQFVPKVVLDCPTDAYTRFLNDDALDTEEVFYDQL